MLEILCVALAVYYESRGEAIEGQYAVASVIWNRVADPRWPNDACSVVSQKGQFESWPLIKTALIENSLPINNYLAVASYAYEPTTPAVFFATSGLLNYTYLETIGNHDFYITGPYSAR